MQSVDVRNFWTEMSLNQQAAQLLLFLIHPCSVLSRHPRFTFLLDHYHFLEFASYLINLIFQCAAPFNPPLLFRRFPRQATQPQLSFGHIPYCCYKTLRQTCLGRSCSGQFWRLLAYCWRLVRKMIWFRFLIYFVARGSWSWITYLDLATPSCRIGWEPLALLAAAVLLLH